MVKRVHLAVAAMALIMSACAQPKEDPKVAELQKELEAVKQDLAAAKNPQAGGPPGQADPADAAAGAARSAQPTGSQQSEQADRDRAATQKALADQQAALSAQ